MKNETLPDLNQITLIEGLFLECLISNGSNIPILPSQITSFSHSVARLFPMANFDQRKVAFEIRIKVSASDAEDKPLPVEGSFRIYISFHVENLPDLVYFEERFNRKIPTSLLTTSLIGVAYSTARGMIMSKVADTVLEGLTLPLISARQLMEESQPSEEEVKTIRAEVAEALGLKPETDSAERE